MGTVEISAFAFRLAALYVWIQTILQVSYLPMIVSTSDEHLGRASWIGFAISVGLHALLGTLLWFASPALARRTLGEPSAMGLSRAAAIGGLGLRLAGIFVIDVALQQVWDVIFSREFSSTSGDSSRLWASTASLATLAILGVGLVVGGGRLAARMFRSVVPEQPLALELQPVAFSVLGIVIVVRALPTVLSIVASAGWFELGDSVLTTRSVPWPAIAANFLRLAIGIALFLGGGLLSRAWHWTQTAGLGGSRAPSDAPRT